MLGKHIIKAWSTNQNVVALSSGEAEYYAIVKGGTQTLGTQSLLRDMGVHLGIVIYTDASAAKGMASRRGLGKVRHIDVSQLWVQDKIFKTEFILVKVGTHDNIADAMTKSISADSMNKHIINTGAHIACNRHKLLPAV